MFFDDRISKAMHSGMDALWMKQQVHTNNIANYDTPNYKAKTIDFQELMETEVNRVTGKSKNKYDYVATVSEDNNTVMRLDGSNVDLEKEELELWRAYAQYSYVQYKVNANFQGYNTVLNKLGG